MTARPRFERTLAAPQSPNRGRLVTVGRRADLVHLSLRHHPGAMPSSASRLTPEEALELADLLRQAAEA